jgi:uncharacterized membrane protein HdeD (DUF308 family)
MPIITTLTMTLFVGVAIMVGGIVEFIGAFTMKRWGDMLGEIVLAVLAVAAGFFMLRYPGAGMATLTLMLGWYFVIEGLFRLGLGLRWRPAPGWGRMTANGTVTVLLGILVLAQWPSSSLWVLGMLVGVKLLMNGIALMNLSLLLRPRYPAPV